MHPVDDVEEGEGEREEDPGEAVDLRGRVERSAGQHCRFLPLFPEKVKVFDLDPSKYRPILSTGEDFKCARITCMSRWPRGSRETGQREKASFQSGSEIGRII